MKKIFFSIFILAMTLCLAFGSAYIIKDWDILFSTSEIEDSNSDPPVVEPGGDTDNEPEPEQKVEITDWTFFENSVSSYKGTAEVVNNIPSSYSMEYIPSSEEVQFEDLDSLYEYIYSQNIESFYKITFNGLEEKYFSLPSFSEYVFLFVGSGDISTIFPAKIQLGEVKYYEGDDFEVDSLQAQVFSKDFYENNVSELIIPENIKKIDVNAFTKGRSEYINKVIINCNEVVKFTSVSSGNDPEDINVGTNVYVKAELLEEYKTTYPQSADHIFPIGYEVPEEKYLPYVIEDGVITAYTGSATDLVIPSTYSLSSDGQAIEGSDYTITEIGDNVFKFSSIEKIDMSSSLILKLGNSCFVGALSLKTVILSNCLTTIGIGCFSESAIETIDLPDSVIEIGKSAFFWCSALNSVTLSNSLQSLPYGCFSMCSSLTTIVLPETISSLGENCFGSSSISSINFPDSLTSLPYGCFGACNFVEIDLSDTQIETLGEDCFGSNELLTKVVLNDLITSLPDMCFYRCFSLSSIIIPESVISLGDQCFDTCSSLNSIILPSALTSFGEACFYRCSSLSSIVIPASVRSWGKNAFLFCESLSYVEISHRPGALPTSMFSYSINTVVFNDTSFYSLFLPGYIDYDLFKNPSVVKFKSSVDDGSNSWLNENYVKTIEGDYNVYTRKV